MGPKAKIMASFIASVMTAGSAVAATTDMASPAGMEKCYGVAKAGMNDCATAKASCAGSAIKDKQADAFIFMPAGLCNKIVGGSIKSKE